MDKESTKKVRGRVVLAYMQRLSNISFYQFTEPLGLNTLAAYIEEKGYKVWVLSAPAHEIMNFLRSEIKEGVIDAVGLYCDYENQSVVGSFSRKLRQEMGVPVFVGGPQAVALGQEFLKTSSCNAVVRGEGEYTLEELLEFFLHGLGRLEDIKGIAYIDDHQCFIENALRRPIEDLDVLPIRIKGGSQTSLNGDNHVAVLTGRGCPFRCSFCYEGSVPGKVRLRSVPHVMSEIYQALQDNPSIKYIWFADDTFTLDWRRVESFCHEITALRKDYDVVWFCECHPSTMIKWPQMLKSMVNAGLVRMQIGLESGSPHVLKLYNKQTTIEQIKEVAAMSMECGLPQLAGNFIIGGAAETTATFKESLDFAETLLEIGPGMTDLTSTFFLPLPKTAITCNPCAYGLTIFDHEALSSLGDVAVAETSSLNKDEITLMRQSFTNSLRQKMIRLLKDGQVDHERILQDFRLKINYGIQSNWYKMVYRNSPIFECYYTLLARGAAKRSSEIDKRNIVEWRPQRTMDLWIATDFSNGYPCLEKQVLSPLEYDLLLQSSGKQTTGQVLQSVYSRFCDRFADYEMFSHTAMEILQSFERKYWLVFVEI